MLAFKNWLLKTFKVHTNKEFNLIKDELLRMEGKEEKYILKIHELRKELKDYKTVSKNLIEELEKKLKIALKNDNRDAKTGKYTKASD